MDGNKTVKIVTHSSGYHTDDVFAVATTALYLDSQGKNYEIIRSRDPEVIASGDYVMDVGGIYDESKNRFDHHQEGGAGKRENGVPYAAFGLVWRKFGEELCGSKKIAQKIDRIMVQPVDSNDNGVQFLESKIDGLMPFDIGTLTFIFQPTWKEETPIYETFLKLVGYAKEVLKRQILISQHGEEGEKVVLDSYIKAEDKRLIFTDSKLPWEEVLSQHPEPLYVIYRNMDSNWTIKSVRDDLFSYEPRKRLPEAWAGKTGSDLEKVCGVEGALFCHNARFMGVANSKEAILKMAEIALKS